MRPIINKGKRLAWSEAEVSAMLDVYFEMLRLELSETPYSKAPMVRELMSQIDRSKGSIEAKMMNTSAVLQEAGKPYVRGYKPLGNAQGLLRDIIGFRLTDFTGKGA